MQREEFFIYEPDLRLHLIFFYTYEKSDNRAKKKVSSLRDR